MSGSMQLNIDRLATAIEKSGLTKPELAAKCGCSRQTLDNILDGIEPHLSTIADLSTALGVSIDFLMAEAEAGDGEALALDSAMAAEPQVGYGDEHPRRSVLTPEKEALYLKYITHLQAHLKDRERLIEMLREEISRLRSELNKD